MKKKHTTWKFYSKVQRLKLKIKITTWAIEKEVTEKNPKNIYINKCPISMMTLKS